MTNEEMALQVQAGDGAVFDELTRQNRGVIHKCAWRLWLTVGGDMNPLGAEYDDMVQFALLGLYGACLAYDQEKDFKLLSYLWRQMLTALRDQYRDHRNDAFRTAISCDDELNSEDSAGYTLLSTLPSEQAAQAFADSEEGQYQQQSRAALERALDELPENQATAIRQNYFEGQGLRAIGGQFGLSTERARQIVNRGIKTLRRSKQLDEYRAMYRQEYTEAKAYQGTGYRAFRAKRGSSVERLVERLEWLRETRSHISTPEVQQHFDREIEAATAAVKECKKSLPRVRSKSHAP